MLKADRANFSSMQPLLNIDRTTLQCSELISSRRMKLENQLKKFDIYKHPLLPQRILKNGFSWPALLIGPVWLLFKRLWVPAAIIIIGIALLNFFNQGAETPIFVSIFCEKERSSLTYGYYYGEDCLENIRNWNDFLILLVANVVIAVNGNEYWARDLINRGYVSEKSIQARSLDDALAIIAREKIDFDQTQPIQSNKAE